MSTVAARSQEATAATAWKARLELRFAHAQGRTTLAHRDHAGPLAVQKPFHPEGDAVCQVVVVHPPGGVAGGDALTIALDVGAGAHAQLTMPAAAKWYRSAGAEATQHVAAHVGPGAVLEWLPQGAIVFDGARACSTLRVALAGSAHLVAWELVCLGRAAAGERFDTGRWRQRLEIVRDDALIWSERADLPGGSPLLAAAVGLNGAPVFGTFAAMAANIPDELIAACRAPAPARGASGVTRLPQAIVARYLGDSTEAAHAYFTALWTIVRPALTGRAALPPRIWST